jgi:hypothetical protein
MSDSMLEILDHGYILMRIQLNMNISYCKFIIHSILLYRCRSVKDLVVKNGSMA